MISLYLRKGNGTGTCKMCGKRIAKGDDQIVALGYNDSGRIHLKCVIKKDLYSEWLGNLMKERGLKLDEALTICRLLGFKMKIEFANKRK